jgi:hypothetical protein
VLYISGCFLAGFFIPGSVCDALIRVVRRRIFFVAVKWLLEIYPVCLFKFLEEESYKKWILRKKD